MSATHVLRCYNCNMYQVDLVKKIPKWRCKICFEKQSIKKIFFSGLGKECREVVQELNIRKLSTQEEFGGDTTFCDCNNDKNKNVEKSTIQIPNLGNNLDIEKDFKIQENSKKIPTIEVCTEKSLKPNIFECSDEEIDFDL